MCGGFKIEYVKTSIGAFDPLFSNGGYPKGSTILVLGGPGSGKSIFGMQFIYKGAVEYGEPGIYVTLDETPEKIKKNIASFGWDLEAMEAEKKIVVLDAASARAGTLATTEHAMQAGLDINSTISQITSAIEEINATRLVIDSLSIMNLHAQNDAQIRTSMLRLSSALSGKDVTSLVLNDARTGAVGISEFPQEAFVFDGVITLSLDAESQERRVNIRKMRGTKHVIGSFRFDISESGINVMP
ncbi:MAG: ATPase domain-containing protein [Candidatus Hydrothermarchaeaceae archaeon]